MAKTIAVFGAGSGMGKAVARRFGQEGYRIALVARRREPLTTPRSARQLVHHVLPEMLERGDGGILLVYGSSVMFPAGGVSGPVPLMAAARNYILTLHEELAGRGVYAGGLAVRALIAQSQASQAVKAGEKKPNMELPVVEPHELADLEWELMRARNQADVLYPAS
ncbi:SDR family NAD(P)-dependent oxidoreductase [Streptomyces malaysiensis]|uniref:SDR family NAD(P)-dependent oxidoreductase n=1 Tax=Streptomyces malaysiensis TaxID=92644 RepID=UPI00369D7059